MWCELILTHSSKVSTFKAIFTIKFYRHHVWMISQSTMHTSPMNGNSASWIRIGGKGMWPYNNAQFSELIISLRLVCYGTPMCVWFMTVLQFLLFGFFGVDYGKMSAKQKPSTESSSYLPWVWWFLSTFYSWWI